MAQILTIVTVGDKFSGKTELLIKYTGCRTLRYGENIVPEGCVNIVEDIIVDKRPYRVNFMDAVSDDKYKSLRRSLIEKADCILLCYSIPNRISFQNLIDKWCIEVRKYSPRVPIILVGTEVEARSLNDNSVSTEEGIHLKFLIGAHCFIECSVEAFKGIDDIFIEAVRSTYL